MQHSFVEGVDLGGGGVLWVLKHLPPKFYYMSKVESF